MEKYFLKELCVYVRLTFVLDIWYTNNELIDERSALTVSHLRVLSDPNFLSTFRNLKRLYIRANLWPMTGMGPDRSSQEAMLEHLNQLNHFHQLEHLELHNVLVGRNFELKLSGLKTLFYSYYSYDSVKPFPQNLEVLGLIELIYPMPSDCLKVLIVKYYTRQILELVNLERLHLDLLRPGDEKPPVFVARFPKLHLLDIHQVNSERHMNELLQELARLKNTRNIQFYHRGFEISNEKFQNPEMKLPINTDYIEPNGDPVIQLRNLLGLGPQIELRQVLSVACKNPGMMRPFFYFRSSSQYSGNYALPKHTPFELLKSFTNMHQMFIGGHTTPPFDYDELRNLLSHNKQILFLAMEARGGVDAQFLVDLPKILEKLVSLQIYSRIVIESLEFLKGFGKLLAFKCRFMENEQNRRIIESIEERRKSLSYPLIGSHSSNRYYKLSEKCLVCENFLTYP